MARISADGPAGTVTGGTVTAGAVGRGAGVWIRSAAWKPPVRNSAALEIGSKAGSPNASAIVAPEKPIAAKAQVVLSAIFQMLFDLILRFRSRPGCAQVKLPSISISAEHDPSASDKFFSNGLDLKWHGAAFSNPEIADPMAMVADVQHIWAPMMSLPVPTIAAVNGHAFAGGAMFALAHDQVLMRQDRGFWCVNELLLKMRFTPGTQALLSGQLAIGRSARRLLTADAQNVVPKTCTQYM